MSFEKVNACRMNKSFTPLPGITELDIENSNSTSDSREKFSILPIHSPIPSPIIINITRDLYTFSHSTRFFYRFYRFVRTYIYIYRNYPIIDRSSDDWNLRNLERGWGILRSVSPSVHSNALKKKKKAEFAAARFYDPFGDLFHRTIVERVVRTGRNRVVRYDRERCLVNVSQNVSFIVCGIVFQRNSRFFFLFFSSPFPYFFPRIRWKEIFESRWIPSGFPKLKNRCFAGEKRKKRKEKNKLKGKDFTGASRASGVFETCSKRVRTIQAGRIGAFIYSSRNSFVTRQTCKNTKIGIAFRNLVRRGY